MEADLNDLEFGNFDNTIKKLFPEFNGVAAGFTGSTGNFIQGQMSELMGTEPLVMGNGFSPVESYILAKESKNG